MKRVNILPSKHVKSGHYRPVSETPSERCFAGGPMVARILMLATFFNARFTLCSRQPRQSR